MNDKIEATRLADALNRFEISRELKQAVQQLLRRWPARRPQTPAPTSSAGVGLQEDEYSHLQRLRALSAPSPWPFAGPAARGGAK